MRVLGAIIAGGVSARMGQDKAFVEWRGKALIEHVTARLVPQVDRLVISCKAQRERFDGFGFDVVQDVLELGTPLAGLHAVLAYAKTHGFDAVLSSPCDTPLLPLDLLQCLSHPSHEGGRWRAATDGGLAAHSESNGLATSQAARPPSALSGTFPLWGKGAVLAGCGAQVHYLTGIWPISVLDQFERLVSPRVKDFAALVQAHVVHWPESVPDPFINLNTPQELSDLQ